MHVVESIFHHTCAVDEHLEPKLGLFRPSGSLVSPLMKTETNYALPPVLFNHYSFLVKDISLSFIHFPHPPNYVKIDNYSPLFEE